MFTTTPQKWTEKISYVQAEINLKLLEIICEHGILSEHSVTFIPTIFSKVFHALVNFDKLSYLAFHIMLFSD